MEPILEVTTIELSGDIATYQTSSPERTNNNALFEYCYKQVEQGEVLER